MVQQTIGGVQVMTRFEVILTESIEHTIELDAEDKQQAIERAYEIIVNAAEDIPYTTESEGTKNIEAYEVEGEEG
jgi:AAA15 family ATPase/GTPase